MKMVFKVLTLLMALSLILGVFAACGKNTQDNETTPETTAGATQAETEVSTTAAPAANSKINVPLPDGWTSSEDAAMEVKYAKSTASLMIKQENGFAGKDLDTIASEAKAIFNDYFDDVKFVGDNEKIKVGGKDAVKFSWTAKVAGMDFKYIYVYVPVNGVVYAITFGDLATTFDDISAEIDPILQSITFS